MWCFAHWFFFGPSTFWFKWIITDFEAQNRIQERECFKKIFFFVKRNAWFFVLKFLYVDCVNLISTVIRKYFVFLFIFPFFFACFSMLLSCLYVYRWATLNGIKLEMKANPALKFIRKNLSGSPSGTPSGLSLPTQQEIVKWKQGLPYEANLRVLFFFHAEDLVCFPSREPKVMNRIYHYSFHCIEKNSWKVSPRL